MRGCKVKGGWWWSISKNAKTLAIVPTMGHVWDGELKSDTVTRYRYMRYIDSVE